MYTSYEAHTWTCDSKDCKNKITRSGDIGLVQDELTDSGWALSETILGRSGLDICPECATELEKFIFGVKE